MIRTRFAPSPTGHLHIGHARAAKEAFEFANMREGHCLLRIEDTDHTRCKSDYTQAIYKDLDWLGFDWPLPVRVQSQNYPEYARIVINLIERGLAYSCPLTRADIKAGKHPSASHTMSFREISQFSNRVSEAAYHTHPKLPAAIRLNLSKALDSFCHTAITFEDIGSLHKGHFNVLDFIENLDDPIIARKDIGCSYLIASTHDDAAYGISHVIRGADLFSETPLQVLIQALMGWNTPLYYHHDLVTNAKGEKLAKRNLDTTLQSLRAEGLRPKDIWNMVE